MKTFKVLFTLAVLLLFIGVKSSDDCFNVIKSMAGDDKCYCSRADLKKEKAKTATTAAEFAASLKGIQCTITYFSCGWTRSWITEVFEGTSSATQFQEFKYDKEGTIGTDGAGYTLYTSGQSIIDLFTNNNKNKSSSTVVYHMRMTGTQDHVWTIEQLPNNEGYRVYQSYNDAYSVNAWLATDITGLFARGDIIEPGKLKATVEGSVKQLSNNAASFQDLSKLPAQFQALLPYITFVRDYKEAEVIANFSSAWKVWGQGKKLTWTEFSTYLNNIKTLADYFQANDATTNIFPKSIYDLWITMFGSPDPVYWYNLPNNVLSSMLLPGKTFRFEIMDVTLAQNPPCKDNAAFFAKPSSSSSSRITFGLFSALLAVVLFLI